jgi:hypothetical protein
MSDLKPCPFCGYPYAGEIENGETLLGFTHFACAQCQAQVIGGNEETAARMWNTRPMESALRTEIMILEAELEECKKWLEIYRICSEGGPTHYDQMSQ